VILFEKEKYPFHKVCGEYISFESKNFLNNLGLPLDEMQLPVIDSLFLTAPDGRSFQTPLPLGGFGISRYKLDNMLAETAKSLGVHLIEETRVDDVVYTDSFLVRFSSKQTQIKTISANICCAAYGKRTNLDIKWKRRFLEEQDKSLYNYVGVKYHVQTNIQQRNVIGLHNFKNGYCGISQIEGDKYCLCYMTKAENLRKSNNNIRQMEQDVLSENPHLRRIFEESTMVDSFPVTISQINFNRKTQVENHMLMLGDAAGMITPLCGNGMSMALHSAKIAAELIHQYLESKISRIEMENSYVQQWHRQFSSRLKAGRMLQRFFGSRTISKLFVQTFRIFPFLAAPVVKMTHGKPF
jgi:flavin-dependent dehydrogenase